MITTAQVKLNFSVRPRFLYVEFNEQVRALPERFRMRQLTRPHLTHYCLLTEILIWDSLFEVVVGSLL